jgi:Pentapeptide repeats (8 copies)
MNEQNRLRLDRITKRHAIRRAQGSSEADDAASFFAAFARMRDEVLRPAMEDVARQLAAAGHEAEVANAGDGAPVSTGPPLSIRAPNPGPASRAPPGVALFVRIPDRGDSRDTIRFRAYDDPARGWQTIAEVELTGSPMELTRFDADEPVTRDIIEQLLVDAVEQLFASTPSRARRGARAPVPTSHAPVLEGAASAAPEAPAAADAPAEGGLAHAPPTGDPLAVLLGSPGATAPRAPSRRRAPPEKLAQGLPADAPAAPAASVRTLVVERLAAGRRLHGLDLASADLHGLDLRGAPLAALDLRGANLRGAVLAGARLAAARLDGADLSDADLTGADLGRADLTGASLAGARLEGAVLTGTLGMPSSEPKASADPARPGEPATSQPAPCLDGAASGPKPRARFAEPEPAAAAPPSSPAPAVAPTYLAARKHPMEGTLNPPGATAEPAVLVTYGAGEARPPAPDAQPAASAQPAGRPPVLRAPKELSGTMDITQAPRGPALPFAMILGGGVPLLTLEEYAALRANLTVKGEEDAETWKRFGIKSAADKEALQATFASRFRENAAVQKRFIELLQTILEDLRSKAPHE